MIITIDLDDCYKYELSPNKITILNLIKNNVFESYSKRFDFNEELDSLVEKGYISNNRLTEKGKELFPKDPWLEFKELYPTKDGLRRLHTSISKSKAKFELYVKKGLFKEIMKGLSNEIELRKRADETDQWMNPWKAMSTYLNNMSWKEYVEIEKTEDEDLSDLLY